MILHHHDLEIEMPDVWWVEVGMDRFTAARSAYRAATVAEADGPVFEVLIEDIAPVWRNPGVGIFNSNEELTARERVLRILKGFRADAPIPPIELVEAIPPSPFRYKLTAGTHRLYCSLAAGFRSVPAVKGFDITAPYI